MNYPQIDIQSLTPRGRGLSRPECVVAHSSGCVITPCWSGPGGVSWILPTGETRTVLQSSFNEAIRPNGIAIDPGGNLTLAHLGDTAGGVFTLHPDGKLEEKIMTVDAQPLPPTNFVVYDTQGRLWITVSTRKTPRADDYRSNACTGFIAVAEPGCSDATLVADGLGYTNECVIDEGNQKVFVNETFGRRLSCFELTGHGELLNRQTLSTFGEGTYPDGLALAEDGSLWVTSIVSNRVLAVSPSGQTTTVLEDIKPDNLAMTESAFLSNRLGREHLGTAHGHHLPNLSNLAFAGKDLKTLCFGNLLGSEVYSVESPVAGRSMVHWDFPVTAWLDSF